MVHRQAQMPQAHSTSLHAEHPPSTQIMSNGYEEKQEGARIEEE